MKKLKLKQIYTLLFFGLLSSCLSFIYAQMAPIITEATGYSPKGVTQIIATVFIISGVAQIYIGKLFDLNKGKLALFLSFIAYLVGHLLLLTTHYRETFIIVGAFFAVLGLGGIHTSHLRLTKLATEKENIEKVSYYDYFAHNIGFSTAAIVAYFCIKNYLEILIYLDILTTLISVLGYFYFYKQLQLSERRFVSSIKLPQKKEIIKYHKIWKKIIGAAAFSTCLMFPFVLLPNIYKVLKLDTFKYQSMTCFVNGIIVIVFGLILASKIKSFSKYKRFLWGTILTTIGFVGTYFIFDLLSLIIVTFIWTIGEILSFGPYSYYFFHDFSEKTKGQAAALYTFLMKVGSGLFLLLISPMLNISLLFTCFISGVVPVIAFVFITTKKIIRE